MRERNSKIIGVLIFIALMSGVLYLTIFVKNGINKGEIKMIQITGNNLLGASDYLKFAKLDDPTKYSGLSLPVIYDRILKHPYVANADVEYDGVSEVNIEVVEKKIKAVVLSGEEPMFITDQFELLPLFGNTKFNDLPIISNLPPGEAYKPLSKLNTDEIKQAFKIIDAAKLANEGILKRLSEINLRHGGDIILTFSGIKTPVIFGKNGAAKKLVYLDIIWDDMVSGKNLVENSEYIDLRFANEIYVGKSENTGMN
ncbi:MAG: FtsQ-type POTRA domain-containing protein [Ignavibacteriaceae bacterium]